MPRKSIQLGPDGNGWKFTLIDNMSEFASYWTTAFRFYRSSKLRKIRAISLRSRLTSVTAMPAGCRR